MKLFRRLLGRPSEAEFAGIMMEELRRIGIEGSIDYVADEFRLDLQERGNTHFWLGNAYAEYLRASRTERRNVIETFALTTIMTPRTPETFAEVRSRLLPKIRNRGFYELTPLRMALAGAKPGGEVPPAFPHGAFSEYLALGLVIDYPDTVAEVGPETIQKWGVSIEEALDVATDNLWKMSDGGFTEISSGVWISPWSDTHDASRLSLTNLMNGLRVKGDVVAMVPNRNVLLVTGSDDVEGLVALALLGKKAYEDPRNISGIPVIHDGDKWIPFLPTPDHPAHATLRELRYRTLATEYNEQKSVWDAWNDRTQTDIYIANYKVYKFKETGALRSVGVWSEGVSTLVPRTDFVIFMRQGKGRELEFAGEAPWEKVESLLGIALHATDMTPTRFRTERFPTAEELKALCHGQAVCPGQAGIGTSGEHQGWHHL